MHVAGTHDSSGVTALCFYVLTGDRGAGALAACITTFHIHCNRIGRRFASQRSKRVHVLTNRCQ